MDVRELKKLLSRKHLSEFTTEQLFTDFGLYEEALINTANIRTSNREVDAAGPSVPVLVISEDVEALHNLINSDNRLLLPCPACKDGRPFTSDNYINPRLRDSGKLNRKSVKMLPHNVFTENIFAVRIDDEDDRTAVPPVQPHYSIGHSFIADLDSSTFQVYDFESYRHEAGKVIQNSILNVIPEVRVDLTCTMDSTHLTFADFIIYPAVRASDRPDVLNEYDYASMNAELSGEVVEKSPEVKEAYKLYKEAQDYLIIKKVGQFPSMADMQLFDTVEYRNVLGKQYRDFTMALGLYASGVGCGSFVYLRRIFENLAEDVHKECVSIPGWSEEIYEKSRFNEKLTLMEQYGKKLIPDEIAEIKTKLYGVLSKGVHYSSEDECKELFPYMKFAIELILDERIAQKEKAAKIKAMKTTVNSVKTV